MAERRVFPAVFITFSSLSFFPIAGHSGRENEMDNPRQCKMMGSGHRTRPSPDFFACFPARVDSNMSCYNRHSPVWQSPLPEQSIDLFPLFPARRFPFLSCLFIPAGQCPPSFGQFPYLNCRFQQVHSDNRAACLMHFSSHCRCLRFFRPRQKLFFR